MDRHSEVNDQEDPAVFQLTDDEMILLLKGLDLYGYALIMSENIVGLIELKRLAKKLLSQLPKPELNS